MKPGSFLMYRCRACDETFPDGHVPTTPDQLALSVAEGIRPRPAGWIGQTPGRLSLHHGCAGGGTGIADLVAILPDPDDDDDEAA